MAHDRPGYYGSSSARGGCAATRVRSPTLRPPRRGRARQTLFYALSLRARPPHGRIGLVRAAGADRARAARKCWDPERGLFFDLAGSDERGCGVDLVGTGTARARRHPEQVRRRLVEEHLLDQTRYQAPVGIPSVAREEPTFNPRFDRWRCWRGPSWMPTAWLLVPPMRRLGYVDEADRIVRGLARSVERYGYREYYNPIDGSDSRRRSSGCRPCWFELL